jgi:hypothetical protein
MDHEVPGTPAGARRPSAGGYARRPAFVAVAALVLVAVVALVLWLVLRGGGGSAEPVPHAPASAASIQRLNAFASSVGHPVYWAGPQPSYRYELSQTKDGRVYIRYLPRGVKLGDPHPRYLTIGTYPQKNALATVRATAKKQGVQTMHVDGGGLAFQYKGRPTSFYVAYPGSAYQIEVFDPSPSRALQVVRSGQLTAVGAPPRTAAGSKAASVQQLKALAVTLGHPIYWAGAQPAVGTYELTRTTSGSVYIRYLPTGARVGDLRPRYLTVGTYPQKGALAMLKATAAKNHVPTIVAAGGGVALVDPKSPTSVYVAYPNVDLQVEVFDPSPRRARQLVTSGQISPVR